MKAIRFGGSLVLIGLLVWRLETGHVLDILGQTQPVWWLGALACYLIAQLVSSIRWQELSRPLGFRHGRRAFVAYVFAGNFFNLVLPTSVGGDVARGWYLARGTGKPGAAALCVLADRLIGLYVLVAMACVAAAFVALPVWVVTWVVAAGIGGVFGLILLWLLPRWEGNYPASKILKKLHGLSEAFECYRRSPRLLLRAAGWSLLVQGLNVVLVWCAAQAVAVPVPLPFCFVLMPLVTLLTLAPISVNGMGVREGGTALLLATLGIGEEQAVAVSLLWFSIFVAAGLIGAVWYLSGRIPCEGSNNAEPVGGGADQGRARQPAAAA